jgi:hypothetical protein
VRDLADVDLRGKVPPDRLLQRLPGLEVAAGERPRAAERLPRSLPEQGLKPAAADLEDDGEGGMGWSGRLRHEF